MPIIETVVFDEVAHEYRVRGERVPSVTGILKEVGLIDTQWLDEAAMLRGTHVHQACEFDDQGDLDEASLDPAILPYVQAWRRCRAEMGFKILANERRVFHEPMRYCGTLDRIVELRGRQVIIDLKTGATQRWHALQVALYALAMRWEEPLTVYDRASVCLTNEGTYKFNEHKDRTDFDVAKAAVTLAAWKGMK